MKFGVVLCSKMPQSNIFKNRWIALFLIGTSVDFKWVVINLLWPKLVSKNQGTNSRGLDIKIEFCMKKVIWNTKLKLNAECTTISPCNFVKSRLDRSPKSKTAKYRWLTSTVDYHIISIISLDVIEIFIRVNRAISLKKSGCSNSNDEISIQQKRDVNELKLLSWRLIVPTRKDEWVILKQKNSPDSGGLWGNTARLRGAGPRPARTPRQ